MKFPVTGNDGVKNTVENMISAKRIPHAILIEGADITAKTALSRFICSAAVCENEVKPCGECDGCRLLSKRNHPDVTIVTTEKDRKTISVNQVREIILEASVVPQKADKKIFIIEPADAMTVQAQNALLKILEEPPKSVVFILNATNRNLMLSTVISRCTLLSLTLADEEDGKKTESLADRFFEQIKSGSQYELMKLLAPLEKDRTKALDFYNELEVKIISDIRHISSPTLVCRYDRMLDTVTNHKKLLKSNANLSLLFTILAAKITER